MARPSGLMQRWKAQKAKARRSGYYGRGLMKKEARGPFLNDMDSLAYTKHASSARYRDLCRLFGYTAGTSDKKKAWEALFDPPAVDIDPKLAVELRVEQLRLLNQDPHYRLLRFNFAYIEGDENSVFNLVIFFEGNEYFLVEKRVNYIRRSSIYSSKDRMMDLHHLGRIQWAARVSLV